MYALNIDPKNPRGDPAVDQLRHLNVEMVRYTYHDSSNGDHLDPGMAELFTQKVREYHEAGIDSLIILTYDTYPDWPALDASDAEWDSYIERFARRAGQIANLLFSWGPAFQIWNEPDHPVFPGYAPTLRPEVYGRMLRHTYDAIKAIEPDTLVIAAGLATGNPAWLGRVIDSLGGDLPADVIAFHPYGQRPDPDWPHPDWFFGYVGDLLERYYEVGKRRPIWITEMGALEQDLGNDRQQVAEFVRRYYRTIATRYSDKVQQLFWYCYSDGMGPTFGLVDLDDNPKPAFYAFRDVAALPVPGLPQTIILRWLHRLWSKLKAIASNSRHVARHQQVQSRRAPAQPTPYSESFTPSTDTFVVPFRQHISMEVAQLRDQIARLQDQVEQLESQIAQRPTDADD
jgi:hypothetical protein